MARSNFNGFKTPSPAPVLITRANGEQETIVPTETRFNNDYMPDNKTVVYTHVVVGIGECGEEYHIGYARNYRHGEQLASQDERGQRGERREFFIDRI